MNEEIANKTSDDTMVKHLTDDHFQKFVTESSTPVLVDFWAPWCGPCRMLSPVLDQIAQEIGDKVKIAKMNVDENPVVAQAMNIQAIPLLALFKDGKLIHKLPGVRPKQDIIKLIETSFEER